jgi:type IV fimbrial biogenesis protein FimT
MTTTRRQARHRGVTLIESAVVSAVVAVAASSVVPALTSLRGTHELSQAAGSFETDVQQARSMAVTSQAPVRIAFGGAGGKACYVMYTGPAGDCVCDGSGPALCVSGEPAYRTVSFPAGSKVTLKANVAAIAFDPVKGTSTPAGTVRFNSADGRAVHQIVNVMGRVRSCSPTPALPGFRAC